LVTREDTPHLSHPIGLGQRASRLKIDDLFDTVSPKNVVIASDALLKTEREQQAEQIVESDICVRSSGENFLKYGIVVARRALIVIA
jgi:hypothetical protein